MEFHRLHPDFDPKAVFYVLPEAKQPHKLFGQPEYEIEKLRFLAEHGFEIGITPFGMPIWVNTMIRLFKSNSLCLLKLCSREFQNITCDH
jgi:hypothetical protein